MRIMRTERIVKSSAEQAWKIVERCSYGVLAMTMPDGTPYAVPVNFAREGNYLYIHCAQTGEKTGLSEPPAAGVCHLCGRAGKLLGWTSRHLTTRYASDSHAWQSSVQELMP